MYIDDTNYDETQEHLQRHDFNGRPCVEDDLPLSEQLENERAECVARDDGGELTMPTAARHYPTWDNYGNRNAPWGRPGTRTHGAVLCLVQLTGKRSGRVKEYLVRFRCRDEAVQRLEKSVRRPWFAPYYTFRHLEMRKAGGRTR